MSTEPHESTRDLDDIGPRPEPPAKPTGPRAPVVIVDDVHVEYKVFATGKRPSAADRKTLKLRGRGKQMRTVHALKGVSFTAYQNDSIGVIGTNGSGKSTLMRAIAGLTPTSQGAIYSDSRPSLLGVGAALLKDLSGERNVILGGLAMGFTMEEIEERYDEVVEFAGLEKFIDLPMRAYSSGMTARLKFAIASMATHEILIVDEALAVGDRKFRQRSEARIREIRDNAGTVFLVSHSMQSIKDTCSRVIWLDQGTLLMDGDPDEVIREYHKAQDK
ncbi:ABC transporter ATP-binding protein [Aeromicrobium fastidiosum]|uniref:ABC transporter ATP-binding protein n=1 Tax=Aeromicrobium fastidiosum TaxID=52699 RepID=UPI001E1A311F|nr:ABC transporter ATP-binding protein [Aeromicrobium fastidiosum]MBP2388932.1 teichoic acid transport system ATP-binding protein [Aeromicrobium fastidiosum]